MTEELNYDVLINHAIKEGNSEIIELLLKKQEENAKSQQQKIADFNSEWHKVINNVQNVAKDKQGYGYKFADLGSCLDAVKTAINNTKISFGFTSKTLVNDNGVHGVEVILNVKHDNGYQENVADVIMPIGNIISRNTNQAQLVGSAFTYAKRYALMNAFNLASVDDDAASLNDTFSNKNKNVSKQNAAVQQINNKKIQSLRQHFYNVASKIATYEDVDVSEIAKEVAANVHLENKNKDEFTVADWQKLVDFVNKTEQDINQQKEA